MAYTDQTKVQNYLQRELLVDEVAVLISFLIPAIKKWIDNTTGSTFDEVEESTRYFDGGGSSVDIDACTEITAVGTIDNEDASTSDYVLGTDYTIEPQNETVKREIVRRHGCFPRGQRRVAVTAKFSEFDGGVPADIQLVATRLAAAIIKGVKNDATGAGLKSESLEGHSVSYTTSTDDISSLANNDPIIKGILEQHKEILVA